VNDANTRLPTGLRGQQRSLKPVKLRSTPSPPPKEKSCTTEKTNFNSELIRTLIVLELIVTFVDTIPNQSKMSGQFQNQGVQSQCTGTIISRICASIFEGL
jgi:hypothetical protein